MTLPADHDPDGLFVDGPRRSRVVGFGFTRESAADLDARQASEEELRQKGARLRLLKGVKGERRRNRAARAPAPPPAPWHPRFVPPGPKPYTPDQRDAARTVWQLARSRAEVTPPPACECCDRTGLTLHGHHTDYGQPLAVLWLCPQCHRLAHGNARPPHLLDADSSG